MYQNIVKRMSEVKKRLTLIFAFTFGLIILANIPGIGYYGVKCDMERMQIIRYQSPMGSEGSIVAVQAFVGTFQASFNPYLYPITFILTGNGTVSFPFIRWAEPWDQEGKSIVEMLTLRTIVEEVGRNLLYFVAVSALIVFKLRKIYLRFIRNPLK